MFYICVAGSKDGNEIPIWSTFKLRKLDEEEGSKLTQTSKREYTCFTLAYWFELFAWNRLSASLDKQHIILLRAACVYLAKPKGEYSSIKELPPYP